MQVTDYFCVSKLDDDGCFASIDLLADGKRYRLNIFKDHAEIIDYSIIDTEKDTKKLRWEEVISLLWSDNENLIRDRPSRK